ncbi:glycoside hydrolase family 31 protein [Pendulispora albinea]|uniref:Glycoside hydrolase family 31 protein n=1 Tax=Pendulispora albinea TaxID=2741071 RepID=A0ABZ2LMT4_9BACT
MERRTEPAPTSISRRRRGAALAGATLLTGATSCASSLDAPATASITRTGTSTVLSVGSARIAPPYEVEIRRSPFQIITRRGGQTVLQTTSVGPAAIDLDTASGVVGTTDVRNVIWHGGTLAIDVATTDPTRSVRVVLTPEARGYRLTARVSGERPSAMALHYDMPISGHWYGHGETKTDKGGPYKEQVWPLDGVGALGGRPLDKAFGPASYNMVEPFWFTQTAAGFTVNTARLMTVSMGAAREKVADFAVHDSESIESSVFVGRTPRDVFGGYLEIAGKPASSDATDLQYEKVVWNSWAQFYASVTQKDFLDWAQKIHEAKIPSHTFSLDDGWMSHYGDFTWNEKFPDPKAMVDRIHAMGYRFGIWVTLWINLDADNYRFAADRGYLLKSKDDPRTPCTVTWWNGKAGIVDLANPQAREWYLGQLQGLRTNLGVDGFKFDTRFFDERCAPYTPELTMFDYQRLGADMAQQFDLQGMGIRTHWTGAQRDGFVIRQIDKGTGWDALQSAVTQNLALATVGYPFLTTDMIGGSLDQPAPSKQVLVRWAQVAAAMPLMYASTSPRGVRDPVSGRWVPYDEETVRLYRQAVRLHGLLTPYILKQRDRAIEAGEPIVKPLFFDFPSDAASYDLTDEWLLGDSVLAAPVVTDSLQRDVHLPEGKWFDVARGREVRGPTDLRAYPADLGTLPLFVRLGTAEGAELARALKGVRDSTM